MLAVEVSQISKTFRHTRAVEDISFTVERGEIFGLLGPNGAGKTTSIRILLDLYKPDHGKVIVLDGPMNEAKKDRIGYMPEERGLYQDTRLERCLVYLGNLKGLSIREARRRVGAALDRFGLGEYRKKKVKELSKGMQQKAQLIATTLHDPELLIIDEPFSGLDPVNIQLVKDFLHEQNERGAAIIMSSHQLNQVQAMCTRILLMNKGKAVLYGAINDIRRNYAGHAVDVQIEGSLPPLQGVDFVERHNGSTRLLLSQQVHHKEILKQLVAHDLAVEKFQIATPDLDEIFIQVIQQENHLLGIPA